jgi:23S rRNA (cytidine1920-2'-O)/16S rRNA (cytidine1409-2'-O)-methyltransferase
LITIDASFISLKILLPVVKLWTSLPTPISVNTERGEVLALIKPQFEAGRKKVARGKGVVRDPEVHQQVLTEVLSFSLEEGYQIKGLARSPVLGPKGNVEFLTWFSYPADAAPSKISVAELVSGIIMIE